MLQRAAVADARAVILAPATVVRNHAPDVPIIAGLALSKNVERILRAGADFALSVSQVAGQLLAHHVLGETVSLQPRIKLVKTDPGRLEGKHPLAARIRERTGCTVVAVERDSEMVMEFPPELTLAAGDALYICGTPDAVNQYYEVFSA